jgi:hypothetical protein
MKVARSLVAGAAAALLATLPTAVAAADGHVEHNGGGTNAPFTVGVFGDTPYGNSDVDTIQLDAMPAYIGSVNGDPDVRSLIDVGDIHSGKQSCTQQYDQSIADLFATFDDSLVYTPGDNEWTDCQKPAEGGGDPAANLDLVRSTFFPRAGYTPGGGGLKVLSQAKAYDTAHPTDAQYVENVLWEQHGIVFVAVNVPGGSNNDADPWHGAAETSDEAAAQQAERTNRTAADVRWLHAAFDVANRSGSRGVVVIEQSDMWDLDGKAASHIAGYAPFIDEIAADTTAFGGPVLLLEGDSHNYRSDNPLVDGAPCVTEAAPSPNQSACSDDAYDNQPGSYDIANFHRVVVHGSNASGEPMEWMKLTIDPTASRPTTGSTFGPFSWLRVNTGVGIEP